MSDERTRLERAFREVLCEGRSASELVKALADVAMKVHESPTPRPVWPGLEGEMLKDVQDVANAAWKAARDRDADMEDCSRAFYTAAAASLFRALVAGLPVGTEFLDRVWIGNHLVPRAALAALADPYDGGGK